VAADKLLKSLLLALSLLVFGSLQAFELEYAPFAGGADNKDLDGDKISLGHLGANLWARFAVAEDYYLGNALEYRFVSQFTQGTTEVDNFKGTYLSLLSPLLVWQPKGEKFLLAYEHKMQGTYNFSLRNEQHRKVTMSSPTGFRLEGAFELDFGQLGFYYERLTFTQFSFSPGGGDEIRNGQRLTHIGLTNRYSFW